MVSIADSLSILLYPVSTEKAVSGIERDNTLTFVVPNTATKKQVAAAVVAQFNEKVRSVNTLIDVKNRKKARVRFTRKGAAADVATKLKLI